MVRLDPNQYLAKGGGRLVFQHPQNRGLLIKVHRPDRLKNDGPERRFRAELAEVNQYTRLATRLGHCPVNVAAIYGLEDTNMGLGLVVEKVSNGDGELCMTLRHYLQCGSADWESAEKLIREFFAFSRVYGVVLRDLRASNFSVVVNQEGRPLRIVLIDGLGELTLIPLRSKSMFANRLWLLAAERDFLRSLTRLYPSVARATPPFN